jgi:rubrerythrin
MRIHERQDYPELVELASSLGFQSTGQRMQRYRAPRVKVECMTCGRTASIRIDQDSCPRCGAADLEFA